MARADSAANERGIATNSGRAYAPKPSEDYKALLRGEITSEEYVRRLKADVDARLTADRRKHGKP